MCVSEIHMIANCMHGIGNRYVTLIETWNRVIGIEYPNKEKQNV